MLYFKAGGSVASAVLSRGRVVSIIAVSILVALATQTVAAQGLSPSAAEQIRAILADKAMRTPAQQKIDSHLLEAERQLAGRASPNGAPTLRTEIETDGKGRALVDISATVSPELEQAIVRLGGDVVFSSTRFAEIRALVPLAALEQLADRADVRVVMAARMAAVNKINTSEGDVAHGANTVRNSLGADGSGITIGVMSDAVDSLASLQGSGDLPPVVTVLPGQAGSGGSEGTAMLEIVYDLAPGSNLFFATAFGGFAQFAQNILDLQAAGADIIVDDIFYFAESPFQDDVISQAVNTVTAAGVAYFSSAGNAGNFNDGTSGTWEGDYVNGGAATGPIAGAGNVHNFGGGTTFNTITADSPFAFTLQWADPLAASSNDYDLFLLNASGTALLASSTGFQNGTQDPYEQINSGANDTGNRLVVVNFGGAANRFLHLASLRGQLAFNTPGETKGHPTAEQAFGVAAVNVATAGGGLFVGGAANPVETFSSDGPRRVFFEPNGTPITPGNFSSTGGHVRAKPDVAAADGVATATPGFNPFFGTSAAAPHAAAIAALVLDKNANANLRQVFGATALDIEAPGPDRDSGIGILRADLAVGAATHPCCNTGGAGCLDPAIEASVCASDSFCCNVAWDSLCVEEVTSIAGESCDCCEAHGDATGCYDTGVLPTLAQASSWADRHALDRELYASDPDYFAPLPRDTIVLGSEANLRQPTRVRIDRSRARPASVVTRNANVVTFPSEAASFVGGGTPPAGTVGFFWSTAAGHLVAEGFGPDLSSGGGQVTRAVFDFTIPVNSLTTTAVNWEVLVNFIPVGNFTVAVGQLGPVHLDFTFPPIVNSAGFYELRMRVLNEVPPGAGSHTIGIGGTVQLIGQYSDDVSDCVCAADSFCCEVNWDNICVAEVQGLGCGLCESCTTPAQPFGPIPYDGQTKVLPDQDLLWNTSGGCTIDNGDFESGSFAGWTAVTGAGDQLTPWNVATTATSPGYFGNAMPFDGLHFAQNGFDGDAGLTYELYQDITIADGATSAFISWSDRLQWDMLNFGGSTQPRSYVVTVQPAGGGTPYGVLYSMNLQPGTMGDTGYVPHTFDLRDLVPGSAGRTVRVSFFQFIPETFTGPGQFDLDGINILCGLATTAQAPKNNAIPGSRSTPKREAHWRARFAEKIAMYKAMQAGEFDVSGFQGEQRARPAASEVPAGFVIQAGAIVREQAALNAPVGSGRASHAESGAERMLVGTLINFDDVAAPCTFGDTTRLTGQYAPLGVTFLGPGGNDGGAVIDQCGNFDVTGHSSTNFLAFNVESAMADGGIPQTPETMLFNPPVSQVQAKVGAGFGVSGSITMQAYDAFGNLVDSNTVGIQSELQSINVAGESIVRVVLTTTPDVSFFVLDELRFEGCPISYSVSLGTDALALVPISQCQNLSSPVCAIATLAENQQYFWQVTASSSGGVATAPVWSFTVTGDSDGDGVLDAFDNCIERANPAQTDTDGDNIGNACDADIFPPGGGDCNVNFGDLARLKSAFFPVNDAIGDFTGDGLVNFGDLAFLKQTFFSGANPGPGPSGLPNHCD